VTPTAGQRTWVKIDDVITAVDVAVSDVYVRPDGRQLSALAELLACGTLSVPIASVRPLAVRARPEGWS
jgi:hypothetical protein